jgi:large subunit ribosomal protein L18
MKNFYVSSTKARRKNRVRASVRSQGRVRLSVFRSAKYIYAQLIDDHAQCVLAAASSLEKSAPLGTSRANCVAANWVGKTVAERAVKAGVEKVVFDRGPYLYHGCVKALAESARDSGLKF